MRWDMQEARKKARQRFFSKKDVVTFALPLPMGYLRDGRCN
jgi:hypothetical protein